MIGQLDKLCEGIVFKAQRELISCRTPVCNGWCNAKVKLEASLNFLGSVAKIVTPAAASFGKEILDKPHAHIVAHSLELLVYIVYILIVLEQLGYQSSISQGEQFRVLYERLFLIIIINYYC